MAGTILGTENSAGFGVAAVACGGLWWATPPPEVNLDEMLENQELRRWGDGVPGGCFLSSLLAILAELDRAIVGCFPGSVGAWLPLVVGVAVDGLGVGAGVGVGDGAGA